MELVRAKTLLLLDRGFYHFHFWQQLIDHNIHFITRLKKGASIKVEQVFTDSYEIRDRRVRMGSGTKRTPFITLRLIEVRSGKTWHSYLTSVLDPQILPPYVVADLYRRRWRIEEAFNTVPENQDLGIIKQQRKPNVKLIVSPFPDREACVQHVSPTKSLRVFLPTFS